MSLPSSGSYVELSHKLLDHAMEYKIDLKIEISTNQRNGLILWQGERTLTGGTYIALGLRNGHPILSVADKEIFVNRLVQSTIFCNL